MSYESQLSALHAICNKIVIVGQQPQSNDPEDPLSCDHPMWSGYRLMQMAGLTPEEYRRIFYRINLNYLPDKTFKVSTPQKNRAAMIWKTLHPTDTLIILGTAVLKAFKGFVDDLPPCEIREVVGPFVYLPEADDMVRMQLHRVVLIPHPSGLNRWYNDPNNTKRAAETLRRLAGGMGVSST